MSWLRRLIVVAIGLGDSAVLPHCFTLISNIYEVCGGLKGVFTLLVLLNQKYQRIENEG
jgi:hypothetical protein